MANSNSTTKNPQDKPSFVTETNQQKEKKAKSPICLSGKTANIFCWLICAVFAAFSAFILIGRNGDMLYQAQNFSFFSSSDTFFQECMQMPGGLVTWIASFLTQFFYEAETGASIIIALWIAIFFVSKKAMKVGSAWAGVLVIPMAALLMSIVGMGYWLYYIKQQGYWFYGSVGFLICMLMTWAAQISRNGVYRTALVVAVTLTYPMFGWYSLLAALYIGINHLLEKKAGGIISKMAVPIASLVSVAAVPYVCYSFYANIKIGQLWTFGLPEFSADALVSTHPLVPFIILVASPVLMAVVSKIQNASAAIAKMACVLSLVCVGGCIYMTLEYEVRDYNYHAEMRMYRAVEEQDWDKVLSEMSDLPNDANRQMVMFKNLALLNKGDIGNGMFKYNNMGNNPKNDFDTLKVHMVQTGAPLIYMHHAKTNFAIRWCIENTVEYGTSFNNLKILAQCSIVNNEWEAARKYLSILQTSIYYREWADRLMKLVDKPSLIAQYHEFDKMKELHDHMGTILDGDNGLCEMYLLNYFSNTMNKDSKYLQEMTLAYAMVQKDIQLFWQRFFLYANLHQKEDMPIHYQEAAYLYGQLEHKVDVSRMPFNKEKVVNRYAGFQQMSESLVKSGMKVEDVGEAMKSSYGDTFYWFYFFCRNIHSY